MEKLGNIRMYDNYSEAEGIKLDFFLKLLLTVAAWLSVLVRQLVHFFCLNDYWINCHEILFRHSWSTERRPTDFGDPSDVSQVVAAHVSMTIGQT